MAMGKSHDRINIFLGVILSLVIFLKTYNLEMTICFFLGWIISTLLLGPDLDIGPKKRAGILRFFLYPYSIVFKHRGISHSILFGTLTRLFYGIGVFLILTFVLERMNYINLEAQSVFFDLVGYIKRYNLDELHYKMSTMFFLGMFLSDLIHILTDKISSFIKRF